MNMAHLRCAGLEIQLSAHMGVSQQREGIKFQAVLTKVLTLLLSEDTETM